MEFIGQEVNLVEAALEENFPGRWRRLTGDSAAALPREIRARSGWVVRLPEGAVLCPEVGSLVLVLDADYPRSQPRVLAPALKEGTWPHVEGRGLLCLKKTRLGADSGERAVQHIAWAIELLSMDEVSRKAEFAREFATYWERSADGKPAQEHVWVSALPAESKEVSWFIDARRGRTVWASDPKGLRLWLENSGLSPHDKDFNRGWLHWFAEPPVPSSFPRTGAEVLEYIPRDFLESIIRPGASLPVLYGAMTETGPVLVAVEVSTARLKDLLKGFRPSHLPTARVVQSIVARPVRRFPVRRADASYVHGRDHNPQFEHLASKTVAIVGCGSLGGVIARLLAQAGVSGFVLIDDDKMRAHNTSRHVLGARFAGKHKSDAMAAMLREDFPHVRSTVAFRQRIEQLPPDCLQKLRGCDLIVSGGISFLGDLALNNWRLSTEGAPAHLCSWVEPFALAGHALAVLGRDDLRDAFDANGYPVDTVCQWPENVQVMIEEAGCGNTFQPHGAVELQRTALMAARLALDVLLQTSMVSCRRTWQGDRSEVLRLGGSPSESFVDSNREVAKGWFVQRGRGVAS